MKKLSSNSPGLVVLGNKNTSNVIVHQTNKSLYATIVFIHINRSVWSNLHYFIKVILPIAFSIKSWACMFVSSHNSIIRFKSSAWKSLTIFLTPLFFNLLKNNNSDCVTQRAICFPLLIQSYTLNFIHCQENLQLRISLKQADCINCIKTVFR